MKRNRPRPLESPMSRYSRAFDATAEEPETHQDQPDCIDGLTVGALIYLAVPNLIFLFGWFRLPVALLLCGAMLFFLYKLPGAAAINWRHEHSATAVALILTIGSAWAVFGGGSHFMYANPDWVVRDAVLGDLINQKWPVHYLSPDGLQLVLRSAIGYFLPLAIFGSIFGVANLDLAIFAWTATGVCLFLFLLPLPRQGGWPLFLALLLAVFFSGMDFLGQLISTQSLPMFPLRLEWWAPLSYPSLSVQLLWAPNHCLPIWIGTLLLLRYWNRERFLNISASVLPLTLIWTPFAALGLLPFVLLGAFGHLRKFHLRGMPWSSIAAAAVFSLPVGLFLLLDIGNIDGGVVNQAASQVASPVASAVPPVSLYYYLLFITCEFLLLAIVLAPHARKNRETFGLAVLILIALPLIRFGPSNDLLLRLSTPPLVILLVTCLQTLFAASQPAFRSTRWIAWLFLAIGAHSGFNELWRAASYQRWRPDYRVTLAERQGGHPAPHYVGAVGNSRLQSLLKPISRPNYERGLEAQP